MDDDELEYKSRRIIKGVEIDQKSYWRRLPTHALVRAFFEVHEVEEALDEHRDLKGRPLYDETVADVKDMSALIMQILKQRGD